MKAPEKTKEFNPLEEAFSHPEAEVRYHALEQNGLQLLSGDQAAIQRIRSSMKTLLADPAPSVRAELAVNLGIMDAPFHTFESYTALSQLLRDPADQVRAAAAAAWGDLRTHRAESQLLRCLFTDRSEDVRFESAIALARLQNAAAKEVLEAALTEPPLRLAALQALGTLGDPTAKGAIQNLLKRPFLPWGDTITAWGVLYRLNEAQAAQRLTHLAQKGRIPARIYALSLLAELKIPGAHAFLLNTAKKARVPLRIAALRALPRFPSDQTEQTLTAIIRSKRTPAPVEKEARSCLNQLKNMITSERTLPST